MFDLVERLKAGDHVALFYKSKAEQFSFASAYIAGGLERNERCLYIANDNSVGMILRKLSESGVKVEEAHSRHALSVVTKQETYLRHGIFEPAKMIQDLRAEVQRSLALGFTAFRATGEMTWALDSPSPLTRLIEYESSLQAQFPGQLISVCQYDETRFPEHVISEMIQIHPKVMARGELLEHRYYRGAGESGARQIIAVDRLFAQN